MMNYHINKKNNEIIDQKEIQRIIRNGKYIVIAMCRNNEPYIATLSYGYDDTNSCLYFHSALKGLKMDIIKTNPEVIATIIEDHGYQMDQCKHPFSSVVIKGTMTLVETTEGKIHAMHTLMEHLEESPEIVKKRLKNDRVYNTISILKLEIEDIRGKSGS